MKNNASENNNLIKVFVTVKTCSSFLSYVSLKSFDIALKGSSSWKVSKFLLAALFSNMRRVDVSKFPF